MFEFQDGFYADVRIEDRYSARIRYRNGAMEESTQSSVKKAFIRVYDGKMWYYSSVCDTGHIQAELDKLYAMATPDADILSSPVVSRLQANRNPAADASGCRVFFYPYNKCSASPIGRNIKTAGCIQSCRRLFSIKAETGNYTISSGGKVRVTEVPTPSRLSRRISMPRAAAPCLTMDSPSPVPPISREWLLSTR